MDTDQIIQQYQAAIDAAQAQADNLGAQYDFNVQQLAALPDPPAAYAGQPDPNAAKRKQYQTAIETLGKAHADAAQTYIAAIQNRAKALQQAASDQNANGRTPEEKAANSAKLLAQAQQDTAAAQKATADLKEWQDAAPDRKAAVLTQQRLANAQADSAELQNKITASRDPIQTAQLQAQLQQQQTQQKQLEINSQYWDRQAAAATTQQEAGAQAAQSQAQIASAQAGTAKDTAQAQLQQLQLQVDQLRRQAAATTDDQMRKAVELELQSKETALAQAQANVAATTSSTQLSQQAQQETIARNQQGTIYGLQQRKQAIKDMIARGEIDPQKGMDLLQQEIQSSITGITPQQAFTNTQTAASNQTGIANTRQAAEANIISQVRGLHFKPGTGAATGAYNLLTDAFNKNFGAQAPNVQAPLAQAMQPTPPPASPQGGVTINVNGQSAQPSGPTISPPPPLPGSIPAPNTGGQMSPLAQAMAPTQPDPVLDWHRANMQRIQQDMQKYSGQPQGGTSTMNQWGGWNNGS